MAGGPVPGGHTAPATAGTAPRPVPRARGSIALPIIGVALVLACVLALPWAHARDGYVTLPHLWSDGLPGYLSDGWLGLLLPAALMAFAGTMDSLVLRIRTAIVGGAICLLIIGVVIMIGYASMFLGGVGPVPPVNAVVVAGLGGVVAGLGYALLSGLSCRIVSGLLLLAATAVHVAEVRHALPGHADIGAYVAGLGYLLCAAGCLIGPRYVRPGEPAPVPPREPGSMPPGR